MSKFPTSKDFSSLSRNEHLENLGAPLIGPVHSPVRLYLHGTPR